MAKAALSTPERPRGALSLLEHLQRRPRWQTHLAARAEYHRLMQPVVGGFVPSDEQKRTALERAETERLAALAEFDADRQAGKIHLFGHPAHPLAPLLEIPSDAAIIFRFGTSSAVERLTGTEFFNVCVVSSAHEAVPAPEENLSGYQSKRTEKFLIGKWPPFGVPPDNMTVKAVRAELDKDLASENRNKGLRTPGWDTVSRCIERAKKKAKAAARQNPHDPQSA